MSDDAGSWCLIESDPGVFTELIKDFGVSGLQVEELWSFDPEDFDRLKPVHGLIFLFKWIGSTSTDELEGNLVRDDRLYHIFFARQVIQNACATQAIISILMNCNHSDMNLGTTLTEFKEFTKTFDPSMKGLSLSNSNVIRSVHNSFARQSVFEFDQKMAPKDEDIYHFVSYIPIKGRLYELDGLKRGPVDLGKIPDGKDWTDLARSILQERIGRYNEGEIHFNLMAVVSDRKMVYERKLQTLQNSDASSEEIIDLKEKMKEEESKRLRYKMENIRRKHNYLPLIVQFIKELANQNQLIPLFEKAKEKSSNTSKAVKKSPVS